MGFLSDAWFESIEAASSETESPDPRETQSVVEPLVLQHVVSGGPDGEVCYHVRVLQGQVQIVRGPAVQPNVTFVEDYATAAAIASGELSAAAALLAGRIRVAGDMGRLVSRQGDLTADDPIPSAVRATTTY